MTEHAVARWQLRRAGAVTRLGAAGGPALVRHRRPDGDGPSIGDGRPPKSARHEAWSTHRNRGDHAGSTDLGSDAQL